MGPLIDDLYKEKISKARHILRALDHPVRIDMLNFLATEHTVTEIYVQFGLEQSVASQHLRILRDAGCVKVRRDGKNLYYSADVGALVEVYRHSFSLSEYKSLIQTESV